MNSKSVVLLLNGLAVLLAISYLAYIYLSNQPDPMPNIELAMSVDKSEISESANLKYTIEVKNTGNIALKGVKVSMVDPSSVTHELVQPDKSLNTNNRLDVDEVWKYAADYGVSEAELSNSGSLQASVIVRSKQTKEHIFESEVSTLIRNAVSSLKNEFLVFKKSFVEDRSNESYEGYGRNVKLGEGLPMLEEIAFRGATNEHADWLLRQYKELFDELIKKPGYTIRTNPERTSSKGERIGATGTAMQLIRSADTAGLCVEFFSPALSGISKTYQSLIRFSDKNRIQNLERWILSVAEVDEIASARCEEISSVVSDVRKKIYDQLNRLAYSTDASDPIQTLMRSYRDTIKSKGYDWYQPNWVPVDGPQVSGSCDGSVSAIFRYKSLFGLVEYDKDRNSAGFTKAVERLKQFCEIKCVEVASTSARARGDIRKRLKVALGRDDLVFVSNPTALSKTKLQIYTRDSQNCRSQ